MGSDPGSDLPTIDQSSESKDNSRSKKPTDGERCSICGLVARNHAELVEHIQHAHRQEDTNNAGKAYSDEQKIDPFIKTED
jgi:hypothetical protein